MSKTVLYWFRTDLRLADSPALKLALDLAPAAFYPVWCWDPHYVYSQQVGPNRWQFLLDSMKDVSESITKLNKESQLLVVRGPPTTILPALFKDWGVTDIVWEKDDDAYTIDRDAAITAAAKAAGVNVHVVLGHNLYDSDAILKKNKGKRPTSYASFQKTLDILPKPAQPIPAPSSIPSPGTKELRGWSRENHSVAEWQKTDVNKVSRTPGTTEADQSYVSFAGPNSDFGVPTMEELGMIATGTVRGGEKRGLKVFEDFMKDKTRVSTFEKPKTSPAAFEPASTTMLSPHLKFGTLSVRTFYHRVMTINAAAKGHSTPPESLIGQLLWREYFHANQWATKNYSQIRGNALSRYIHWDLQTKYDAKGVELERGAMEEIWRTEEPVAYERLMAWKEGRTGFPWIDALMRQLKQNGWMHHLGRHSVACFLTRGHLWISWERGTEVFAQHLVDHDASVNEGNWMWLSASAFFHQYYRVYSPATYGQKSDKSGALIRKYCPELDGLPDKYIYEPWKATPAILKSAKVVLGVDYPKRIIDDAAMKDSCMKDMKAAYAAKLYGNDPKVLNGTADAYIATFHVSNGGGAAKEEADDDDDEDVKPKTVKRKAPAATAVKGKKQTKLSFKKEESDEDSD